MQNTRDNSKPDVESIELSRVLPPFVCNSSPSSVHRCFMITKWKRNCDYEWPQQILYRQILWTTDSFDDTFDKSKRQRKTCRVYCCLVTLYDTANEEVVTKRRKGKRERKNEKWEQNLTWTLAILVTSFPILCFVPICNFARSPCSFIEDTMMYVAFFLGGARNLGKKENAWVQV